MMKRDQEFYDVIFNSMDIENLERVKWEYMISDPDESRWTALAIQNQIDEIQKGIQWLERNPQLTQNLSE